MNGREVESCILRRRELELRKEEVNEEKRERREEKAQRGGEKKKFCNNNAAWNCFSFLKALNRS